MLRLLMVPERPRDTRELLPRYHRFALQWGVDDVEAVLVMDDGAGVGRCAPLGGAEIRVVPVPVATSMVDRLDAGLFLRPLPDQLIVVGREPACSPAQMCFLTLLLELRRDVAGITTGGEGPDTADGIVRHGGAFRAGVLVSAGGFLGDGRRPLRLRLASFGYDSVAMPMSEAPLEELTA